MHAKYKVSISYGSKVIAKVKVDNIQTGQKQYAPNHSMGRRNKYYWQSIQEYDNLSFQRTKQLASGDHV